MGKVLDATQVEQFHRDGFHAPVQVASAEEAFEMRGQLEAYEAEHGGPLKGSVRFKSHLLFKWLADFVRSPSVLDPVEDIIGPDIMVWSTDGGSRKRTPRATSPGTRTASTGGSTATSW